MNNIDLSSIQREPDNLNVQELKQKKPNQIPEPEKISPVSTTSTPQVNNLPTDNVSSLDRRKTILKIKRYLLEFEKNLQEFQNKNLEGMANNQLEELLNEIRFTVSCRNVNTIALRAFKMMITNIEFLCCNYTTIRCQGLSAIANDQDLLDTVKECSLENMEFTYVKPIYRILYAVIQAMLTLHVMNSGKQLTNEEHIMPRQIQENINSSEQLFTEKKINTNIQKINQINKQFDSIHKKKKKSTEVI